MAEGWSGVRQVTLEQKWKGGRSGGGRPGEGVPGSAKFQGGSGLGSWENGEESREARMEAGRGQAGHEGPDDVGLAFRPSSNFSFDSKCNRHTAATEGAAAALPSAFRRVFGEG